MKSKGREKFLEQSLVILKPDTVQRGLVGEIITRFEKKGLKIVAMKMVWPSRDQATNHYDQPEEAARALGTKTITSYAEKGIPFWTDDPMKVAKDIQKKLVDYLIAGPVVAMVIEGTHAIEHVRKIRGNTSPLKADIGSITADYTVDSYFVSDEDCRAMRNLVHASGTVEEAKAEIKIWFKDSEISNYNLAIEEILYSKEWENVKEEIVSG